MNVSEPLYYSTLSSLPIRHRGKVRDLYDIDEKHLLIVTTDRLSAFDCILPDPIPGKGKVLTTVSHFWLQKLTPYVAHHLSELSLKEVLHDPKEYHQVKDRAVVVRKLSPLPIEAVVRGYLIGSGWKDYQKTGAVCGITLPAGLRQAEALGTPLFTPSTKAHQGQHDENISFDSMVALIGIELAEQVREVSLKWYLEGARYAKSRGLLIADTKFEFGTDERGTLHLIDEILTPDSSRFWPSDKYQVGMNPPSFDKQFVRDYLEEIRWNKEPPAPTLPIEIIRKTAEKYKEAEIRLTHPYPV